MTTKANDTDTHLTEAMYAFGEDAGTADALTGSPFSANAAEDGQDYYDGYVKGYNA